MSKKLQVSTIQENSEEDAPMYFLGNINIDSVSEESWYEKVKFVNVEGLFILSRDFNKFYKNVSSAVLV